LTVKGGKIMNLLSCTIVGLLVGGLAGQWVGAYGRHRTMDLVMGGAGGLAGGILVMVSAFLLRGGMIASELAALLGAVVLIFLSRHLVAAAPAQGIFRMRRGNSARVIGLMRSPAPAYARNTKRGL
jgi:uncharacterized membrane protein YeaQ/YmgE (transglycosylase-associated protein family)